MRNILKVVVLSLFLIANLYHSPPVIAGEVRTSQNEAGRVIQGSEFLVIPFAMIDAKISPSASKEVLEIHKKVSVVKNHPLTKKQRTCLRDLIFYESNTASTLDQMFVVDVIYNRIKDRQATGKKVSHCEIINEKMQFQFVRYLKSGKMRKVNLLELHKKKEIDIVRFDTIINAVNLLQEKGISISNGANIFVEKGNKYNWLKGATLTNRTNKFDFYREED